MTIFDPAPSPLHSLQSYFPTVNNGAALLDCFIFLYFVAAGAGAWSVDEMLARRRACTGA
jgi:putative oxidoreductase